MEIKRGQIAPFFFFYFRYHIILKMFRLLVQKSSKFVGYIKKLIRLEWYLTEKEYLIGIE
jgi:hypothetical protein